jgi:hypothetical protein
VPYGTVDEPEVEPWRLPPRLGLRRLDRINPSSYQSLKLCRLKGVWIGTHARQLLPSSPQAHLGRIIHKVLEMAGSGQIDAEADFDGAWQACLEEEERKISTSWNERHFTLLSKAIDDYEVRREQCRLLTNEIIAKGPRIASQEGKGAVRERFIQTSDGAVGGYPDLITFAQGGAMISDFKTGRIFDPDAEPLLKTLDEGYAMQLKLYACAVVSTYGVMPISLRIEGLDGSKHKVTFDVSECDAILGEARRTLGEINSIIESPNLSHGEKLSALASPSPHSCKFCRYRPCCPPYLSQRAKDPEAGWPVDASGEVAEKKVLGNGKLIIRLKAKDSPNAVAVRGLDPCRHPALDPLPKRAYLFDLDKETSTQCLRQNMFTTIFVD